MPNADVDQCIMTLSMLLPVDHLTVRWGDPQDAIVPLLCKIDLIFLE